jgi:hypothetical protein
VTATASGFSALRRTYARLGISADFGPPPAAVPQTILGAPLDPDLRALYQANDGMHWAAPDFDLRIYPLTGPDALEWRNLSERRSSGDYVPPYPFDSLVIFAQYGLRASYLASIPTQADQAGHQTVLYVDLHETVWAVPIASSVDRTFALIGNYLEESVARYGRSGLIEVQFPLDVPSLVANDAELVDRVKTGALAEWIRGDVSIQEWLRSAFDRIPRP